MIGALLLAPATEPSPAIDITPYLPIVITAVLTLVTTLIINAARDRSGRMPTIVDVWKRMDQLEKELDIERRARIRTDGRFSSLRSVFLSYVSRVQAGGSPALTLEEREALEPEEEAPERQPT